MAKLLAFLCSKGDFTLTAARLMGINGRRTLGFDGAHQFSPFTFLLHSILASRQKSEI
jgi:hypothetical protein